MAKGRLLWHVNFVNFLIDWSGLRCILCVWYCSKVDHDKEWSVDGVPILRLNERKYFTESISWRENSQRRHYIFEKSQWKRLWKNTGGERKRRKGRPCKKSIDNWWRLARWAQSGSLSWPSSSLLGLLTKRENGCYWRQIYLAFNRDNLWCQEEPLSTHRCSLQ